MKTLPEAPLDDLRKIAEATPFVYLRLQRRDDRGRWQTLPPQEGYDTKDLVDGTLETWLLERHEFGGIYAIEVLDEETHMTPLVPRYEVNIAGPRAGERLATRQEQERAARRGGFAGSGGIGGSTLPRFTGPTSPYSPRDFMSQPPDAIAMQWAEHNQQTAAVLQQQLDKERERHRRELEAERERNRQLELTIRDNDARHRDALAELRQEMLVKLNAQPQRPDYAPLLAAVVPVFTALIEASSSRSRESLSAQQKSMEMQMSGLQSVMSTVAGKKDDGGTKMLEIFMPMMLKSMDERSPGKMADLLATMSESQMAMLSLTTQAMRDLMPEESDNPLHQILFRGLEGIERVVSAVSETDSGAAPTQSTPNQLPAQQTSSANGAKELTAESTPEEMAQAVYAGAPAEYQTRQWLTLFTMIHDVQTAAPHVARQLAVHLDRLDQQGRLPALLQPVMEQGEGVAPSAVLRSFLERLPVAAFNPQRLDAICRAFDNEFEDDDGHEAEVVDAPPKDFGVTWTP